MKRLRALRRAGRERGAAAVILGLVMMLLLTAAAIGVDIAKLSYERQALKAAVDAAAQAGSYALPDATKASADAKAFALASAPDLNLNAADVKVDLFCAVAVKSGTTNTPDESQVPGICNPGAAWSKGQAAKGCNDAICLLPCALTASSCNTIKVSYTKQVDFVFGPAINIPTGSTGAVSSAACRGLCGTVAPNPMDVVVVADRTSSMSATDVSDMKVGIEGMLKTMTPEHQYVALATIHKGPVSGTCRTAALSTSLANAYIYPDGNTDNDDTMYEGSWVATAFSNNYVTKVSGSPATSNLADPLMAAVKCLERDKGLYGTHLAGAMKGAARYLLGYGTGSTYSYKTGTTTRYTLDPKNNLASLPSRADLNKEVRKVIVFETDGEPNEQFTSIDANLSVKNSPYDVSSTADKKACSNLLNVAQQAKDAGVLVLTIATGNAARSDNYCFSGTGQQTTKSILAQAASPRSNGEASSAGSCDSGNVATENGDGDYFFCASDGADLQSVFLTAFGTISGNTKLVKVGGVAD